MEGDGTSASSEPLLPSSSATAQTLTLRRSNSDASSNVSNRSETAESSIRRPSPLSNRILVAARNSKIPILTGISILLSGIVLGCVVPKNNSLPTPQLQYLSSVIGWIYFLCWTVSFIPQIILNKSRRSTTGLSEDFSVLNVVGFFCYTIYTCAFFYSKEIQHQYQKRFNNGDNSVQSNDVFFAIFALSMSLVQVGQIVFYNQSFSFSRALEKWTRIFLFTCVTIYTIFGYLVYFGIHGFKVIDFLYLLSSTKLIITIIKYVPQVILNYNRKSTVGWNIWNILLDFSGGTLSVAQIIIDSLAMNDFSAITGNYVKFALGFVSIFFDIIFMVQHYFLYPSNSNNIAYNTVENSV